MRMEALDLYCGLVAVFLVLLMDAMVSVKHSDDIIRRLKMEHAELQGELVSLSKDVKALKQGAKSSVKGLKNAYGDMEKMGVTIMRLKRAIQNCKQWDNSGWGVSKFHSGNGDWYKVLVRVDSDGHRSGGWRYWCDSAGYDHSITKSTPNNSSVIPPRLKNLYEELRKIGKSLDL